MALFDGIDLGETTPAELERIERNRPNFFLSLARKRPMTRSALMARSPMRKSRPKAIPAKVQAAVRKRAHGKCEYPRCRTFLIEGVSGHLHHILKCSQGGKHTEDNLRLLCREHHEWVESHPKEAVRLGLSVQLRKAS